MRIQKYLKNINWFSCSKSNKASKCHTFLVFFIIPLSWPGWFSSCFVTLCKIFSKINQQTTQTDACPNTTPFFHKIGLRKFVFAEELFVPRPCFILYLTAKRHAMFSWPSLQVIFSGWYFKPRLKTKIWNYIVSVSILVQEPVGKWFFITSRLEICVNLNIKINSSLAGATTRVPGERIWSKMFNVAHKQNEIWLVNIFQNMVHCNKNKTI